MMTHSDHKREWTAYPNRGEGAFIPLVCPTIEADDVACLVEAAKHGRILQGDTAWELEEAFGRLYGLAGGTVTSSGTAALHLALRALDVGTDAEVIVPSYTCLAVLHAVHYAGATPVLVDNLFDVRNSDFNLDVAQVAHCLSDRTGAVIVPHLFGRAANVEGLLGLGVPIVEDITLSLGSCFRGRPVGTFGDLVVCSLHGSKMIAAGEGGILLARENPLADRVRQLNGWVQAQAASRWQEASDFAYEESYNYRMSDIHAALALNQLGKLDDFIERRLELARRYTQAFEGLPGVAVPEVNGDRSCVFFRYMVSVEGRDVRNVLRAFQERGIEAGRGVFPALHHFLRRPGHLYPNAERAIRSMVSIPLYPALTEKQVRHIIESTVLTLQERAVV